MKTFAYNGQQVVLQETEDREDDNIKIFHDLVCEKTGKCLHSIDWSPYRHMCEKDVELYLSLGCPTRKDIQSIGPIDSESLQALATRRNRSHERSLAGETPKHATSPARSSGMGK